MRQIKTITIGDDDSPCYSLCPGHVTAKEFNKAHKAEGWDADPVSQDDLRFEYWIKGKKSYRRSVPEKKGAKPYTVMSW